MPAPILLVEDNADDVLFLERAFRTSTIDTSLRVVTDGAAAIDYLMGQGEYAGRSAHPLPAVMLLDVNLPAASGFVVLR